MAGDEFGLKLALVLKALTLSNGRVAAALAVDKSLVGRWAAGNVRPSAHSLARLTAYLATLLPGLTLLDWDLPLAELQRAVAARIGTAAPAPGLPPAIAAWLAETGFGAQAPLFDGQALAGFWRTTRPSPEFAGRFVHDPIRITASGDGTLVTEVGMLGGLMKGWVTSFGNQMFLCATEVGSGVTGFIIANHLGLDRVEVMDGVIMGAIRGGGGVPTATPVVIERVGDLSGDTAADEARFAAMRLDPPLAPEGMVPDRVARHLDAAMAPGGLPIISMPSMTSLARGVPPVSGGPGLRVVASKE
jgi:hypothetical protein